MIVILVATTIIRMVGYGAFELGETGVLVLETLRISVVLSTRSAWKYSTTGRVSGRWQ
ncbi:MAG: hypothetical protein WDO15_28185 [Bacteroidota bacterium]